MGVHAKEGMLVRRMSLMVIVRVWKCTSIFCFIRQKYTGHKNHKIMCIILCVYSFYNIIQREKMNLKLKLNSDLKLKLLQLLPAVQNMDFITSYIT